LAPQLRASGDRAGGLPARLALGLCCLLRKRRFVTSAQTGTMRIFVNNVDGFLAGAICADLYKLSHNIIGTRKGRSDTLVPPVVKRTVPRVEVRKLLKAVAGSDVVIYDLHDADLEELELVLQAIHTSEITQDMIFILVSSVGVWARTQRTYEEVTPEPEAPKEPPPAAEGEAPPAEEEVAAEEDPAVAVPAVPVRRPVQLKSEDYVRRIPSPKFHEWKAIETMTLSLQAKPTVTPYVVCAGIPYGNGEDALLGLFKAAWQSRPSLRVIGDGSNYVPVVHARDVARIVRHAIEMKPPLQYHLAVDRGDLTQRALIQAVASEFGIGYEIPSVSVPEAILAELADILTMDLRLEPSPLTAAPPPPPEAEPTEGAEVAALAAAEASPEGSQALQVAPEGEGEGEADAGNLARGAAEPSPASFRWWCEEGLAVNIVKVAAEFARWRRLTPLRFLLLGPPGCGSSKLAPLLGERYGLPVAQLDDLVEELRNEDSPLGQSLREKLEEIEVAKSNPKAQGPFFLPKELTKQVVEAGLLEKTATKYRGYVLSGFPVSMEEAKEVFLEDPPPVEGEEEPPSRPASDKDALKVLRMAVVPDLVVKISSADEACVARLQEEATEKERPITDAEIKQKMERWKKENPEDGNAPADALNERGLEPFLVNFDEAENPSEVVDKVSAHLESKRQVFNFRVAPKRAAVATEQTAATESPVQDVDAEKREAEARRKKKEEEDRLEQIKREEFVRLEKHSEPLRQYLMTFVVPTLTSGLIDVCRATPEDPVGYLAEYLSVYSEKMAEKRKKPRRSSSKRTSSNNSPTGGPPTPAEK